MELLQNYFLSVLFYTATTAGIVLLLHTCKSPLSSLTTHFDPGKKAVRERIEGILDTSRKKQGWWIVVLVLVLCLISGSFFSCTCTQKSDMGMNISEKRVTEIYRMNTEGLSAGSSFVLL